MGNMCFLAEHIIMKGVLPILHCACHPFTRCMCILVYLMFVVPCIMLNSEINPTRCNNCVYSSQWLYSTCFG